VKSFDYLSGLSHHTPTNCGWNLWILCLFSNMMNLIQKLIFRFDEIFEWKFIEIHNWIWMKIDLSIFVFLIWKGKILNNCTTMTLDVLIVTFLFFNFPNFVWIYNVDLIYSNYWVKFTWKITLSVWCLNDHNVFIYIFGAINYALVDNKITSNVKSFLNSWKSALSTSIRSRYSISDQKFYSCLIYFTNCSKPNFLWRRFSRS